MVKAYKDSELLERVKSLPTFKGFPTNRWVLGVRSNEDQADKFDDKFYLFEGETFLKMATGTTNPGVNCLKNYDSLAGRKGAAIVKADEWYYEVWEYGLHKGKVIAYRQQKHFKIVRDSDKDLKSEDSGAVSLEICGINMHPADYNLNGHAFKTLIGGWSEGCQVFNSIDEYVQFMRLLNKQPKLTYCLINEF
jgi:hypothetical protein